MRATTTTPEGAMGENTPRRFPVRNLFIALLALAVLAAGGWWWQRHRAAPSEAVGVVADPNEPFKALDCKPRLFDDRPALAVVFSQPVDAKQNLAEFMKVVDLGPAPGEDKRLLADKSSEKVIPAAWVVGDNPRIAYFPAIQPERRFRIEVSDKLTSRDGKPLVQAHRCELQSEAMPASFFFASRGVVLPAGQNGGLPVVTVNVPEVDLQFLKVQDSALPRFLEQVAGVRRNASAEEGEGEGDSGYDYRSNPKLKGPIGVWELDQLQGQTKSVYLGRFLTEPAENRRRVTHIPVEGIKELQEPGVYVAVMSQPGRFAADHQVTYFYVSDIGVQARRYSQTLDAFATSLKSGSALGRGVRFELLDDTARSLAKADADGDGHAHFDSVPASARLLVARRGDGAKGEMTVLTLSEPGLDLSEFDVGGHLSRNVKLFAYAGRDLYRPGESFTVSVLARDPDGKPMPALPVTATLKRPDGKTVSTATWRASDKLPGYPQQTLALPADAQTGAWQLELRADPGAKRPDTVWPFQVEEFLPERLKLDLKTAKAVLLPGDEFAVQVQGDYLFGSPASGNRLLVSAATERDTFALPSQWPGFQFGDFADDRRKKREDVADQTLDEQGAANVSLPISVDGAQSPMKVRGSFSLLESGGRPVVRSIERTLWPAPQLIAVRPLFDSGVTGEGGKAEFELIRVDAAGKPQPAPRLPLRLVHEERQYYWRYDDQKGWHSGYTESEEVAESGTVAFTGTRLKLSLPVRYGSYRLEVDDPQTKQTLRYRFYAGWGAQDAEDMGNRPDRVQLKLAKAPYKAGDRAELTITPPHDGTALVTVEGDSLLWSKRIDVKASGSKIDIPVDVAWARHDLYIGVTAFRPGSQGDRVTPARAVGLVHLPLQRSERQLKVSLQAPAKVLPEKRTTVKVKVDGLANQTGIVTLSAVDVGILNITRYKTPDAFDFFFGKHRFAPELLDMYGKLIEKMDGITGKLKFGGDSAMRDSKSLPKKVKLVDLFSGPVALDAKGEAQIALDIPDFNGTLRLMAVASTADRFGKAEAEMVSAAPLVAELATPRFISPGDNATVALDITNLSGAPQDLKLTLEASDPVKLRDGERTLSLKHQQRVTLRFPVEATDAYGLGRLRIKLTSASGLKIERESVLQVQPPVALERDVRRVRLAPGESLKIEPQLVERFFKASSTVSVSVSNKPPLNVQRIVQGLLDYPYGCLEQTTSAAYPHLFIDEAAAKAHGLKPRTREERQRFVDGAIARLAGMQKANGGFTLWGDGPYEVWISAYVIGFLQDARAEGFTVPDAMFKNGQDWLLQQLQQAPNRFPTLPKSVVDGAASSPAAPAWNWRDYDLVRDSHQRFAELAHAGYILARDQKAPLAMLRLLHDQYRDRARSPLPLVHLSIALKLMGDEARAKVALDDAMKRPYGISPGFSWGGYEWLGDYGSAVRDLAMSYALLARHQINHPQRENLLFDLADRLGSRQYHSTQERLALLLAARAAGGTAGGEWTALLKTGDDTQALHSTTTEQRSVGVADLAKGMNLTNRHSEVLFVELEAAGYPSKAPAPRSDVIEVQRSWFEADGKPWSPRTLKVGEMLIVRVQARAKQRINDGLIVDRVPAGLEIENLNLSQGPKADEFMVGNVNVAQAMADARIQHREYRDDRYVAAAHLDTNWLTVFYLVRVVSPGHFVVPATFAEDMYRPELRGVGPQAAAIEIADPAVK
jgi:uncharacterized protein YfaS (alpha-2-macroglobulin family)